MESSESPHRTHTSAQPSKLTQEEARIRLAYQRRAKPPEYYSFFDPGFLFLVQERERALLAKLRLHGRWPLAGNRILEIGCGSGHWLREFIQWGALPTDLTGIDLRPEALSLASRSCPQGVMLRCMEGCLLEFDDETFDIVLQSMVFTSVLDEEVRQQMAHEMLRVMKKDGLIIWYDFFFANPWNPDVRAVRKAEIKQLFPRCLVELERVSLILPVVKRLAPLSWWGCYLLSKLRFFNTFYLGVIKKQSDLPPLPRTPASGAQDSSPAHSRHGSPWPHAQHDADR